MARLAILIPDMRGGGAERVALTLIEGFVDRGHEFDLVMVRAQGQLLDLLPPGVNIIDLNADRMRRSVWPLARYLRSRQPVGLIAMMWPMPVMAIVARMFARSGTRIVTSDHGILSEHYRQHGVRLAALKLTVRLFYPLAERRVASSAGIADDLAQMSGMPTRAIEVIHNPIPLPPPNIRPDGEVEALWGGEGARILAVGSLKPEKNHRLLLNAFAKLLRTRDARLMILGEGPLDQATRQYADALGIGDRVVMPGFRADVWPYYASADIFALSSSSEGFGNVLVEAMGAGLPVVSTDCAGPREVLADGRFGRLVPRDDADALAEAMVQTLDEQVDRDALKARAWEFRPDMAVESFLEMLTVVEG